MRRWINNSKNPTWEAVHEALKNIGESVLAEEIASKYNIQPSSDSEENPKSVHPRMQEHLSSGVAVHPRMQEHLSSGVAVHPRMQEQLSIGVAVHPRMQEQLSSGVAVHPRMQEQLSSGVTVHPRMQEQLSSGVAVHPRMQEQLSSGVAVYPRMQEQLSSGVAVHPRMQEQLSSGVAVYPRMQEQLSSGVTMYPRMQEQLSSGVAVHPRMQEQLSSGVAVYPRMQEQLRAAHQVIQEQWRTSTYFAKVMTIISNILEKHVNPKDLVCFLCMQSHPLYPEKLYVDVKILQNVNSVSEIIKCLVPEYINYMETGLLKGIVETFECKEAQSLLQQYHDRYPINRLLRDMPDPVSDERLDLTQRKRLRAKCDGDFHSARADGIKKVKTAIESATGIDQQFVTHAQHSEGSLKLIFLIPESVSCIFQELCDEDLEILAQAGIVEVQIDEFVISDIKKYCPQRTESSTQHISASSADQSGITAKGFDSYIDQRAKNFTSKEKDQLKGLLESIPKSRMGEVCSDSFLRQLAAHMRDWRELAPHFGITQHEAEVLTFSYPDVGEQRYRALHCWKQINPDNATYKELIASLLTHAPFDLTETALKMTSPGMHNVTEWGRVDKI